MFILQISSHAQCARVCGVRAQVTERESPSREHASGEFQTARMRSSQGVYVICAFLNVLYFYFKREVCDVGNANACLDTDAKSPGLQVQRTKSDNRNRCSFDETYNGKRWKCVTVEFPAGSMLVHDMQGVTGYHAV